MAQSLAKEFTKGLWAEIPPFRLVLGLCPTLAVTKSVETVSVWDWPPPLCWYFQTC